VKESLHHGMELKRRGTRPGVNARTVPLGGGSHGQSPLWRMGHFTPGPTKPLGGFAIQYRIYTPTSGSRCKA